MGETLVTKHAPVNYDNNYLLRSQPLCRLYHDQYGNFMKVVFTLPGDRAQRDLSCCHGLQWQYRLSLYRNGLLRRSRTRSRRRVIFSSRTSHCIHRHVLLPQYSPTSQFEGYINEVRIWNVARTQADICRPICSYSLPCQSDYTDRDFWLIIALTMPS